MKPAFSRFPIPLTRDPFINTPLLPLGPGADGEERFWISSYNSGTGCMGVVVTASGRERIYRFDRSQRGFYGAAREDDDTLWLCGDLSCVVRLCLGTGAYEVYPTGAPSVLVFQGLCFDPATRKLLVAAYVPGGKTCAVSFDCRERRTARFYETDGAARYTRGSFSVGDGTFGIVAVVPEIALLHWDPAGETLESRTLAGEAEIPETGGGSLFQGAFQRLIADEAGRVYLPGLGWCDLRAAQPVSDGPRPDREATWFARKGELVWGLAQESRTDATQRRVVRWDLRTGAVESLATLANLGPASAALTREGGIVAVTLYGEFFRHDATTGALELARRLPTDSVVRVDCLVRLDRRRLLGTPFITQRFWELDLESGHGVDLGRAAPGGGQIVRTWLVNGKVYMAAYAGGELMEYDPARPAYFPENPRVVADPPGGMRPVAAARRGGALYYACSLEYGRTGCTLTRYDTAGGEALHRHRPLGDQMITSLHFDAASGWLVAGTTMDADSRSRDPEASCCYLALIDPEELSPVTQAAAPEGVRQVSVVGLVDAGEYLCAAWLPQGSRMIRRWFRVAVGDLRVPALSAMEALPGGGEDLLWTGEPGLFLLRTGNRVELWDLRRPRCLRLLYDEPEPDFYGWHVQDDSVYLVSAEEIFVLEACLNPDLR
ncbi:MAG TPA: hypothetical protein VNQ90_04240 [Chthoniobacteraceae bacterium]|nr:hypothetical protein [Chthoniobacteraceae bacterium]